MSSGARDLTVFFIGYFGLVVAIGFYVLWRTGSFTLPGVVGAISIGFLVALWLSFSHFLHLKAKQPAMYTELKPCRRCGCLIPKDRASAECQECFISRIEKQEQARNASSKVKRPGGR